MASPIPITLVGATGLTGSATLTALLQSSTPFAITTIARKAISAEPAKNPSTTFTNQLTENLFDAPKSEVGVKGGVYASCLGTTRATAGSFAEQEKLDLGLNKDLAQRAKEDGVDTLILVSSGGTSADSRLPYSRMKGQLEQAVKGMGFKSCVILRPGLLLGPRNERRTAEYVSQVIFRGLGSIGLPMGSLSVEGDDVGACIAYHAAHPPAEPVTTLENNQIIEIAKKWKQENPK